METLTPRYMISALDSDVKGGKEIQMNQYIPSPTKWVAEQVELYESSDGTLGTTAGEFPVVIVTNQGFKTGAIRKTPLIRVINGENYILVASIGGAPKNPLWVYNLRGNPNVEIRDGVNVHKMRVREMTAPEERQPLWDIAVKAFPPYKDYQEKTNRLIPVFLAEVIT